MNGKYAPVLLMCLTLGLAPFFPEPHIWGKLRWIAGGAVGMTLIDWGDALMHSAPWLLLIGMAAKDGYARLSAGK
ncbi:MAG TPA: hypothetical protein PKV71_03520 [Calditrichia bacterium]|nr:hypothetical protein [Calditrichota bacterium]HQU71732.1 hypothetical protein [Calditrichia bacterium]HQV30915.1 hypothetical protein [Calditrichia bacterium]